MGKGERKYGGVVNTLMKRITWNIYKYIYIYIYLDEKKKEKLTKKRNIDKYI